MKASDEYILSTYKILNTLSDKEKSKVYLVSDQENRLFIQKVIQHSNSAVYSRLMDATHKNLPQIHHIIADEAVTYVIEEYINGKSLMDIKHDQGSLDERQVIDYAAQLCDVLHYLHTQMPPIIHRDIKPSNIILSNDGIIKLIDFDAAREYKTDAERDTRYLGTKEYAAPEQYGFSQTDTRSDIYSLGVLIYELLTGELPSKDLKYNGRLKRVIDKCLQIEPKNRYDNTLLLKQELIRSARRRHKKVCAAVILMILIISIPSALYFILEQNATKKNTFPESQGLINDNLSMPLATFIPSPIDTSTATPTTQYNSSSIINTPTATAIPLNPVLEITTTDPGDDYYYIKADATNLGSIAARLYAYSQTVRQYLSENNKVSRFDINKDSNYNTVNAYKLSFEMSYSYLEIEKTLSHNKEQIELEQSRQNNDSQILDDLLKTYDKNNQLYQYFLDTFKDGDQVINIYQEFYNNMNNNDSLSILSEHEVQTLIDILIDGENAILSLKGKDFYFDSEFVYWYGLMLRNLNIY